MAANWNKRFINLAKEVASWSRDPSTKCGAVIVRPDKTVASLGFNGFPKGCSDHPGLYADREHKYARVVHAEMNAILHAQENLEGYTLYTWPLPTCDRCAAHVIQAGIKHVVYKLDTGMGMTRWKDSIERGNQMYDEAGVKVDEFLFHKEPALFDDNNGELFE